MPTSQDRPSTKERLLNAAWKLMLDKGFNATSVEEICEAAELTKGSLFHYFQSKEELAKAVLGYHKASIQVVMDKGSFGNIQDPLQRLYGYLEYLAALSKDSSVPRSCLFGNFSQELSSTHPQIRTECAQAFSQWAQMLTRDLEAAKIRYSARADFDPKSLAEHFIVVYEGSLVLAKAKQDPQVIEESIRHFKKYLAGLFQKRRSKPTQRRYQQMPTIHNAIKIKASPEQVWAVLGDPARAPEYSPWLVTARMEGTRRICTDASGNQIEEEISDVSKEKRTYRFRHLKVPLPVKNSHGRFAVESHNQHALVTMDWEFEALDSNKEGELIQMLDGASKQTLEELRKRVESL